jgi:hypothetical protein
MEEICRYLEILPIIATAYHKKIECCNVTGGKPIAAKEKDKEEIK